MRRDEDGPYSLQTLAAMQPPQLFSTDQAALKARYVAWFEAASGRTLYPMQVEMLLIEALAYAIGVLGEEAQAAAEQHLVACADIEGLIALGPNRSTPRLPAAPAGTTLRFSLAATRDDTVLIPSGTRVGAGDAVFATEAAAVIPAGALSVDLAAVAVTAGVVCNGLLPGQISTVLDPVAGVSATNVTISDGGADIEDIDLYRLRLANAFERISTGGSVAWYRETAMGISSAVIDVGVVRPAPCYVDIYPLTSVGPAGIDLRAHMQARFDTPETLETRFGDLVTVKPPEAIAAAPVCAVRVLRASTTIAVDAAAAGNAVLLDWRQRLGAIVAPSTIEAAIRALPGVVDAEVSGLAFAQLAASQFLDAAPIVINVTVLA